ncbi:hypothetical protein M8C21_012076 [Ambrosia artemisiifolia]|uniref:BHLH domain-containing protein n=1 Tax=Ambrosia artemisiifolia TaxID=4212 RepID=A0AAD5C700_AMBAR|nr:hypothetical protein M8C21_012076 [Ambrosia artemisiifolia]
MAAFSHQQHQSFFLDQTVFISNPNTTTTTACFPQFHQPHNHANSFIGHHHDQASVANKLQSPDSSMSMVLDDQKVESDNNELKRKDKQRISYLAQSNDANNKVKKQKKTNDYQEEKKKKNTKKGSSYNEEEGAVGYIHVRARRGQATDSHSLAERVRREKISERMKLLQAIVPGCDKFLSMKLASVNPMLYDFGGDMDSFMLKPDENMSSMVLPIMPSVQQCNLNGGVSIFNQMNDNCNYLPQLIDGSTTHSLLFQQEQMPNNILSQGNEQELWDVDEQRQKLDNRFALSNNLTSFH